ncbi:MAG: hypothetical protein KDE56_07400, partial [Anaerolineales bacterium]|nr:hypothetical protein [Anaerolineales bacterium]
MALGNVLNHFSTSLWGSLTLLTKSQSNINSSYFTKVIVNSLLRFPDCFVNKWLTEEVATKNRLVRGWKTPTGGLRCKMVYDRSRELPRNLNRCADDVALLEETPIFLFIRENLLPASSFFCQRAARRSRRIGCEP